MANGTWSGPFGRAIPPATPTSLTAPLRSTEYALAARTGMVKSSLVWNTIDSSVAVRTVPTSVRTAGIVTGSTAGAPSRNRSSVVAAVGGASRMPSSSSSARCSLSGTRFTR